MNPLPETSFLRQKTAALLRLPAMGLLLCLVLSLSGQDPVISTDTLPPSPSADSLASAGNPIDSLPHVNLPGDTLPRKKGSFFNFRKTPPNPKTALKLSLIFPGSGQFYNGRWWKVPFAYGALGGMIYTIDFNKSRYQRLKTALELQLQNQPHEFSNRFTSPDALRSLRDQYDKQTQLSYIGSVVVYIIVGVEAFVDAHLQNFDVDEDLSIKLKPSFITIPGQAPQPGIGLVFNF